MRYVILALVTFALTGCLTVRPPPEKQSAEEILGTFLLMTALSGKTDTEFLQAVYPLRSQIVTFAIIGFHREKGTWPSSEDELSVFVASSPANPTLPNGTLTGIKIYPQEDGGVIYSTKEDRQRGREFTISARHRVTMKVPSNLFAGHSAADAPPSKPSTISFDWVDAITQAILRSSLGKK